MVVNGQVANQTTFNNAFLSRTSATTSTVAALSLQNAGSTAITDTQKYVQQLADSSGESENDVDRKNYASTNYIVNGDSRKVALERLDAAAGDHETRIEDLESLNSQDITLGTFGTTPNAAGASLVGQVLTMQPASSSNPGGVSTTTQAFAGQKTFTGRTDLQGITTGNIATDSATTGAAAALPAPTVMMLRLTNVSLTSLTTITGGVANQFFILTNATGNSFDVVNSNAGATNILTGTGSNLTLVNNSNLWLYYDTTSSRWRVVGGTGSGGGATLTATQIGFGDGSNFLAGDAAFTWDNTNKTILINSAADKPGLRITNSGSTGDPLFFLERNENTTAAVSGNAGLRRSRGTLASPTAISSGDHMGAVSGYGYGTTTYGTTSSGRILFQATENFSDTARGTKIGFATTPNGTVTRKTRVEIDQDGGVNFLGDTSGTLKIKPAAATTSYTLTLPAAQGAANTFPKNNGSGVLSWDTVGGGPPISTEIASGTGTFTLNAATRWVELILLGGGAGGSGSGTTGAGNGSGGGATTWGAGAGLSIAGGGVGAVFASGTGGAGGSITIGAGAAFASGSIGSSGGGAAYSNTSAAQFTGSYGGGNGFCGSGAPGGGAGGAASNSSIPGQGGGGGGTNGIIASFSGGGGGGGAYLRLIIAAPLTSYAYSVGIVGSGGTAGTNGFAGGDGGRGTIVVIEHP